MLFALAVFGAAAAEPGDAVATTNASILFEAQENYGEALRQMEAALEMQEDDYFVNLRLGWLYYLNEDFNLSEKHYRRALTLADNQSVEALLALSLPLAARNEWVQVENTYQKVLELDPQNLTANLRLGQIYLNRDDAGRARDYLRTALDYYPASYEANLSAGWAYHALGKKQEAAEYFLRSLMMSPADSSATRGLSLVK
jgi:tetratricopeptide (TPR) repeat protein